MYVLMPNTKLIDFREAASCEKLVNEDEKREEDIFQNEFIQNKSTSFL